MATRKRASTYSLSGVDPVTLSDVHYLVREVETEDVKIARTNDGVVAFGDLQFGVAIDFDESWGDCVVEWDVDNDYPAIDVLDSLYNAGGITTFSTPSPPFVSIINAGGLYDFNPRPQNFRTAKKSAAVLPFSIVDALGDPVDLSAKALQFLAANDEGSIEITVDDADITVSGVGSNEVAVPLTTAHTATSRMLVYELWNTTDSQKLAEGDLFISESLL